MAERKYEKYIMTDYPGPVPTEGGGPTFQHMFELNNKIIPGAFHIHCSWISPGPNPGVYPAHIHPNDDELIGFIGTNPDDMYDLGAEAELWMDDEQYIITRSFLAFLPKNLVHCPLTVRDVKRPIFHFDIQTTTGELNFEWVNKEEGLH